MASTDWSLVARSGLGSAITPLGRGGSGLPSQTHGDSYDELRYVGQIQSTVLSQAQVGEVEQQFTPSARINITKPTGVGEAYIEFHTTGPDGTLLNEQTMSQRIPSLSPVIGKTTIIYYQLLAYDTNCNPPQQTVWVSKHADYTDAPSPPCSGAYTSPNPIILATWFV